MISYRYRGRKLLVVYNFSSQKVALLWEERVAIRGLSDPALHATVSFLVPAQACLHNPEQQRLAADLVRDRCTPRP